MILLQKNKTYTESMYFAERPWGGQALTSCAAKSKK
jgi:hypothetical protein